MTDTDAPLITYKGFNKNMQCRGFQYAIGQSYEHTGKVEACLEGFHACEYPLDIFRYYHPAGSMFAVVEQSGTLSRHSGDSKIASSKISIKASIDIAGLVKAAIEYTTGSKPIDPDSPASATGDRGAASATGDWGAASATGKHSVALATGFSGRACAEEGCAIVLVNRADDGSIRHIRSAKVGDYGIKPGVFYTLDDAGEFVEVPA